MGFESKVFVMKRTEIVRQNNAAYIFGTEIARLDLCGIEHTGFTDIFNMPVDFTIAGDIVGKKEADLTIDCYGKRCKYAEVADVVEWLESKVKFNDHRRFKALLAMLREFNSADRKDPLIASIKERLIVVHYGH